MISLLKISHITTQAYRAIMLTGALLTATNTSFQAMTLRSHNQQSQADDHQQAQEASPQRLPGSQLQETNLQTPIKSTNNAPEETVSPFQQKRYEKLTWKEVINRVARMIQQEQSIQNRPRTMEAIKALVVKALHQDKSYAGERYYSRSIFHLFADINNKENASEIWELLLEKYAHTQQSTAAQEQEYMNYLREKGCFGCRNIHGTPLHVAIKNGNYAMVKWLISLGINVNHECTHQAQHQQDCSSACAFPPLHYALSLTLTKSRTAEKMQKIVQKLLDAGADPALKTADGNADTALHIAFRFLHPATASLGSKVTDLTLKNSLGNTAFHVLTYHRKIAEARVIGRDFIHTFKAAWRQEPHRFTQTVFPGNEHTNNQGRTVLETAWLKNRFHRVMRLTGYARITRQRSLFLARELNRFYAMLSDFKRWIANKRRQQ